jgi:hypothetical protein
MSEADTSKTPVQVDLLDTDIPDALYCQYKGQIGAQGTFLFLDLEDGQFTADYEAEIGGAWPANVYHGRAIRFPFPIVPTAAAANDILNEAAPIAQRILDGAEIEWDGNNMVGRLNEDADQAAEELNALAEGWEGPTVEVYDAGDWFSEGDKPAVTASTTEDELNAIAEEVRTESQSMVSSEGNCMVIEGLDEWLHTYREEQRQELREELSEVVERLENDTERRNALIVQLASWKDSSRSIAEYAGISHTGVQKIVDKAQAAARNSNLSAYDVIEVTSDHTDYEPADVGKIAVQEGGEWLTFADDTAAAVAYLTERAGRPVKLTGAVNYFAGRRWTVHQDD